MADTEAKITLSAEDKASPVVQQAAQTFKDFQGTLVDINEYVGQSSRGLSDMAAASQGTIGSISSLTAELKQLTAEFNVLDPESEAFAQHAQDIQAVSGRLSELQGAASGATQGMSSFWQTALAAATGFTAANALQTVATGMKDTAAQAVLSADAMNAMHNRASVIFGSDYPQMVQGSEALGASLGRSATEILGFETRVTALATGFGIAKGDAEGLSTQMASLAVDIGKVYQESDDQALQRLQSALMGNARALGDLQIPMRTNVLDQYLMQQGSKDTMSQLDAESQAQVRLHYLLEQGHTIHEIAVKDTGNLDDELKVLGGTWDDLLRTMGTPIVPAVSATFGAISTVIKDTEGEVVALTDDFQNFLSLFTRNASSGDAFGLQSAYDKMKALKDGGSSGLGVIDMNDAGLDLSLGQTTDALDKGSQAADDWTNHLNKSGTAAGSAGKAADALRQSLDDLDRKYQDTTQSVQAKLDTLDNAHQTKMQSYAGSMTTLESALTNLDDAYADKAASIKATLEGLRTSFEETMSGITQSEEDALAKQGDKIDQLKQKLADLTLRAEQENRKGSVSAQTNNDLARTQAELDKEQASHATQMGKMTPDQLQFIAGRQAMTDTDRFIADKERERLQKTNHYQTDVGKQGENLAKDSEAYTKNKAAKEAEVAALQKKMDVEDRAYGLQRSQLIQTQSQMQGFHDALVEAMSHLDAVSKDKLKGLQDTLADFGTAINKSGAELAATSYVERHTKAQKDSNAVIRDEQTQTGNSFQQYHDTYVTNLDNMTTSTEGSAKRMQDALQAMQTTYGQLQTEIAAGQAALAGGLSGSATVKSAAASDAAASPSAAFVNPYYNAATDGSQAALLGGSSGRWDVAYQKAQQQAKIEINMGEVHIHNATDEKALVESIARQIYLQQMGVN